MAVNKNVLDAFYLLVSDDAFQRQGSIELLTTFCEGLEENDREFRYIYERLLKGLSSANGMARVGFSAALTRIFSVRAGESESFLPCIEKLKVDVDEATKRSGLKRASEETNACIGNLLGYLSIIDVLRVVIQSFENNTDDISKLHALVLEMVAVCVKVVDKCHSSKPLAFQIMDRIISLNEYLKNKDIIQLIRDSYLNIAGFLGEDFDTKIAAKDAADFTMLLKLSTYEEFKEKSYLNNLFFSNGLESDKESLTLICFLLQMNKNQVSSSSTLWSNLREFLSLKTAASLSKKESTNLLNALKTILSTSILPALSMKKVNSNFRAEALILLQSLIEDIFFVFNLGNMKSKNQIYSSLISMFFSKLVFDTLRQLRKIEDHTTKIDEIISLIEAQSLKSDFKEQIVDSILVNSNCGILFAVASFRARFETPILAASNFLKLNKESSITSLRQLNKFAGCLKYEDRLIVESQLLHQIIGTLTNTKTKQIVDLGQDVSKLALVKKTKEIINQKFHQGILHSSHELRRTTNISGSTHLEQVEALLDLILNNKKAVCDEVSEFRKQKKRVKSNHICKLVSFFQKSLIYFCLLDSFLEKEIEPTYIEILEDLTKVEKALRKVKLVESKLSEDTVKTQEESLLVLLDSLIALLALSDAPKELVKLVAMHFFNLLPEVGNVYTDLIFKPFFDPETLVAEDREVSESAAEGEEPRKLFGMESSGDSEEDEASVQPEEMFANQLLSSRQQKSKVGMEIELSSIVFKLKVLELVEILGKSDKFVRNQSERTCIMIFLFSEKIRYEKMNAKENLAKYKKLSSARKQYAKKVTDQLKVFMNSSSVSNPNEFILSDDSIFTNLFPKDQEADISAVFTLLTTQTHSLNADDYPMFGSVIQSLLKSYKGNSSFDSELQKFSHGLISDIVSKNKRLVHKNIDLPLILSQKNSTLLQSFIKSLTEIVPSLDESNAKAFKIQQIIKFFNIAMKWDLEKSLDTCELKKSALHLLSTFCLKSKRIKVPTIRDLVTLLCKICENCEDEDDRVEVCDKLLESFEVSPSNALKTNIFLALTKYGSEHQKEACIALKKAIKEHKLEKLVRRKKRKLDESKMLARKHKQKQASR